MTPEQVRKAVDQEISNDNLIADIYQNAVNHGWHDEKRSFPEIIALCHSELSEALEEYREEGKIIHFPDDVPHGIGIELADCIIRIFDYCGKEKIDIFKMIRIKHAYNKTRPYRHGGKKV